MVNALDIVVNGAMDSTEPTDTPAAEPVAAEPQVADKKQEVGEVESTPAVQTKSKDGAEATQQQTEVSDETEPKADEGDKQAAAASEQPAADSGDSTAAASSEPAITAAADTTESKASGDKTEDSKEGGAAEEEAEAKTNAENSKPKTGK